MNILDQQWLDENSQRSYPLFDEATRLDTTSTFTLPNDLIVDLQISAPPTYSLVGWFVSQTTAYGTGVVITLSCEGFGAVATVTVPGYGFTQYSTYVVSPLPGNPGVGGTMTIGSSGAIMSASTSQWNFLQAATQILPTVVVVAPIGVSSLSIVGVFGQAETLTGNLTIAAGPYANVTVSGQSIIVGTQEAIVVGNPCPCTDSGGATRVPIQSINGVVPDPVAGNLTLVGLGCLATGTATNAVTLTDDCATPCCGSPELDQLATNASTILDAQTILANQVAVLEAGLRQVDNYYTGTP